MAENASANEMPKNTPDKATPDKATPDKMTPPARDPEVAVEEEYQAARQRGTAAAMELFIARHPDSPLAEKARQELVRRPR